MTSTPANNEIPRDLLLALREFTPHKRWSRVNTDARLLHDLLITGDEFHSLMYRLDPEKKFDLAGLNVDEYFPSELSWDALFVDLLGRVNREASITRKYKPMFVKDLLRLKAGEAWSSIDGAR